MATQQERYDATQAAIIQAGRALFSQKDARAVTISDIMKRCGLSAGLFYHYYRSKDEFFASLIMESWGEYIDILHDETVPYPKRLAAYYMASLEGDVLPLGPYFRRNKNTYKMTDEYIRLREEHWDDSNMVQGVVTQYLEEGVSRGIFSPDLPVEFIARLVLYNIMGMDFTLSIYNRELDVGNYPRQFCDFLENILLKPYIQDTFD